MKKKNKIILICVGVIVLLFLIFGIALPYYTEYKIRKILAEDTNFPYDISFDSFKMNLFKGDASMQNIKIIPDKNKNKEENITINKAEVKALELSGFDYTNLYFRNTIYAESIRIFKPNFNLLQKEIRENTEKESKSFRMALDNQIHIRNITIEKANVHLSAQNNKTPKLHLFEFNFEIKNIKIDKNTLKNRIPFTYDKYEIKYDSIYCKFSPIYHLTSNQAEINNHHISIKNLALKINDSMPSIQKKLKWQKNIFDIADANIRADGVNWKFNDNRLQIRIKNLALQDMKTRIYKYLKLPEKEKSSTFYSQKLRNLPFDLSVDSLKIRNNKLAYVEQENFQKPERSIRFSNMDITATDIAAGNFITEKTKTRILANTLFMDSAQTYIDWSFPPANKADNFTFKGKIKDLKADKFNPFLAALARTELTGNFGIIDFDLKGNNDLCKGTMILTYNNLDITILQKNRKKENSFFTSIANLFVKNRKTEAEAKEVTIEQKRKEPNSFFSFILDALLDGIKETFL